MTSLQPRLIKRGQSGVDVRELYIDGTELSEHGCQSFRSDDRFQN